MKLETYIETLTKFAEENPEALTMEVVTQRHQTQCTVEAPRKICYSPSGYPLTEPNAVCVN